MPRSGEELRTPQFVATDRRRRGDHRDRGVAARAADGGRQRAQRARRARVAARRPRPRRQPQAAGRSARGHGGAVDAARSQLRHLRRRQRSAGSAAAGGDRRASARGTSTSRSRRATATRGSRIVERLRARGVTTSWDFGWNPPLRGAGRVRRRWSRAADFVFVNEAEAALYARTRRDRRARVLAADGAQHDHQARTARQPLDRRTVTQWHRQRRRARTARARRGYDRRRRRLQRRLPLRPGSAVSRRANACASATSSARSRRCAPAASRRSADPAHRARRPARR